VSRMAQRMRGKRSRMGNGSFRCHCECNPVGRVG